MPSLEHLVCEELNYISCTTEEILKHLKLLKINKSPGPGSISPVILKSCTFELAPSISFLVNKSFQQGHLPDDCRSADIVPLHKKGSKHLRDNYRLISLTSMICKINEKIVCDKLTSFWQDQNMINKNQFGFLQGRSTVISLLSTFHDFARSRNSSVATDVVFLDLAKAFDSVPHERLLIKLYSLGNESKLLNWLRHFLMCRKQRVVVRATFSDWTPVISGTTQGTILGPILFLSYINDFV